MKQADSQAGRSADSQTDKQTDRQTEPTHRHNHGQTDKQRIGKYQPCQPASTQAYLLTDRKTVADGAPLQIQTDR
jgi:hypothetical protein